MDGWNGACKKKEGSFMERNCKSWYIKINVGIEENVFNIPNNDFMTMIQKGKTKRGGME